MVPLLVSHVSFSLTQAPLFFQYTLYLSLCLCDIINWESRPPPHCWQLTPAPLCFSIQALPGSCRLQSKCHKKSRFENRKPLFATDAHTDADTLTNLNAGKKSPTVCQFVFDTNACKNGDHIDPDTSILPPEVQYVWMQNGNDTVTSNACIGALEVAYARKMERIQLPMSMHAKKKLPPTIRNRALISTASDSSHCKIV